MRSDLDQEALAQEQRVRARRSSPPPGGGYQEPTGSLEPILLAGRRTGPSSQQIH